MARRLAWVALVWFMLFRFANLWYWAHSYPFWSWRRLAIEFLAVVVASIALAIYAEEGSK